MLDYKRAKKDPDFIQGLLISRGRGIRTPGPREGSPVFKTGAINRSTIPLCTVSRFWIAKIMDNSFPAKERFCTL